MREDIVFVQQSLGELYDLVSQILSEIEIGKINSYFIDKFNPYKIPEKGIVIKKDNRVEVYEFKLFYLYLDLFNLTSKIHGRYSDFENSYVQQYISSCVNGILKYVDFYLEFNGKLPILRELYFISPFLEGIKKDYENKTIDLNNYDYLIS
jgi:hypothetical protein